MTGVAYTLVVSILFGLTYGEAVAARVHSAATTALGISGVLWLASFVLPPRVFRFSDELLAHQVLAQLMRRVVLSALLVLLAGLSVLTVTGLWLDLPVLEEMYGFTLIGVSVFHGFGGAVAPYVNYLQHTKQYNSNQVVALLIATTFALLALVLFFLSLDFATVRDAHVHRRDLLLLTAVMLGYGWAVFRMAHH